MKIELTGSEQRAVGLLQGVLHRIFIEGKVIDLGTTTKNKSTNTTTLRLPIDPDGIPIEEPVKSARILVQLQRLFPGKIQAKIIRGSKLLHEGRLPFTFTEGLRRVNAIIRRQDEKDDNQGRLDTVDPSKLDQLISER